jgi:hypothetical protein
MGADDFFPYSGFSSLLTRIIEFAREFHFLLSQIMNARNIGYFKNVSGRALYPIADFKRAKRAKNGKLHLSLPITFHIPTAPTFPAPQPAPSTRQGLSTSNAKPRPFPPTGWDWPPMSTPGMCNYRFQPFL